MRSKLLILAVIALAVIPFKSQAQKLNYGIEVGFVNNKLAVDEYKSTSRNGFKFGANVELPLSNHISFGAGLTFIRKGGKISGDRIGSTRISSIKFAEMNYIQIPVMAGYKFNLGKHFSIKPEVGGYFAVGVDGDSFVTGLDNFNQPYEARVRTFSHTESTDGIAPFRPCDRVDGGLSFALNLNYRHFTIKAGYDLGLVPATFYGSGKHRTFSVSLVYWLF